MIGLVLIQHTYQTSRLTKEKVFKPPSPMIKVLHIQLYSVKE